MINSRNLTSHTYDETTAAKIVSAIIHKYFVEFEAFQTRLEAMKAESA